MEILHFWRFCFVCFLGISLAFSATAPAKAQEVFEIDQIMDMNALTPEDFYRFVPNYLWIEPGDTVRYCQYHRKSHG